MKRVKDNKVPNRSRRSTTEILIDILRGSGTPIRPTNLMYVANMSWASFNDHVDQLVEAGLLMHTPGMIQITEAGKECVKIWDTLTHTLTNKHPE